ncbi:MAG: hypothetical protein R6V28_05970 [Nitriliruptoraceae bacterium]
MSNVRGVMMGNRDRVGHNPKRRAEHTLKEKRAAKQEHRQETKVSSKRKRRNAAQHRRHATGS